ncbi:N-carbamoyl-L-amino-acid hydrolase [Mariprofundus ferrinatatus]|uniref:N-carbamoyl-L-amino-acid hydrolase n=1 Tax=Mariprofundus ferrinatatus TaxID=1921087 RepID=A0A2K8L549_9PROT|nr:hydantoinase/carbamoylase family amidase [Mariprofundus ferrinatatus]ATX81369.1 N-carbamoyl-L-amino-acid hydrolase [Mariprofundus ferrinatatus]
MNSIRIHPEAIERRYAPLNATGAIDGNAANGFLRPPYSDPESAAMALLEQAASGRGLNCRYDAAGNLIIESAGNYSEWIETGSHIDTVPGGGNFDGTAGVVAGLEALLAIQQSESVLTRGVRLRVWRGEESATFGVTSIGSRAAFATLEPQALEKTWQGVTLADAMLSQGVDPVCIKRSQPAISSAERDSIAAFIELHIEQGKVLETGNLDIGIVTAIRGSKRSWIRIRGTFDHSGATPMGSEFRQDANLAMAYMQVELDHLMQRTNSNGADLVQTVGMINPHIHDSARLPLNDNAVTKVSGAACFSFEVRGADAEVVNSYCEKAFALIQNTAVRFGVTVEIDTFSDQPGIAELDPDIQALLADGCDELNLSQMRLPSGAWHDAGTVASQMRHDGSRIPVGMIFIPCRAGISHSRDEYSSPAQIAAGASLLATAMAKLATM